jgi:hypothetical protein
MAKKKATPKKSTKKAAPKKATPKATAGKPRDVSPGTPQAAKAPRKKKEPAKAKAAVSSAATRRDSQGHSLGDDHRKRMAARSRALSNDVCEIGPPPERNEERYERYRFDLMRYLVECFPETTGLKPFSLHHERIINRVQQTALEGGRELNIVFRGFAKSTILENTCSWASGYGHREFLLSIGADKEMAQETLDSIQFEFETNDHLMEIFPAACHAARALEGIPQRAGKQTINGERTHIVWTGGEIVLPTVEGFEGSGCVIRCRGITANLRGQRYKRPDGKQVRPDWVLIDDPQTDESAASPSQCARRLNTLNKSILRLGGHFKEIAVAVNATVIEPDDMINQLCNPKLYPGWRVNKAPMLKSMPARLDDLWLDKYAEIRTNYDPEDDEAKHRAWSEATAFYEANRAAMDEGAEATWEHCYNEKTELSAIQHAVNIIVDTTLDAFMAECQNTPMRDTGGLEVLPPAEIAQKCWHTARGVVPGGCELITGQIDVHPEVLYWHKWAWNLDTESGFLIDRNTWPEQKRRYFAHSAIKKRLSTAYPGRDTGSAIKAGLRDLIQMLFTTEHTSEAKRPMRLARLGIDANGEFRDEIMDVVRASDFKEFITPTFGAGITASMNRITDVQGGRKKQAGEDWIPVKGRPGDPKAIRYDANSWKTAWHRRMSLPYDAGGSLYLYKDKATNLLMLGDHCNAEQPHHERSETTRRDCYVFKLKPNSDNHEFDCAVGSMVMASYEGVFGFDRRRRRRGGPLVLSEIQARRRSRR